MLFNSHVFIFIFLPIVLLGFYRIGQYSRHLAALWLAVASLFFYGWWDSRFVGLLLASIVFNYAAGYAIVQNIKQAARTMLTVAVICNLSLLAYFKYANFFIDSINTLFASSFAVGEFFLPLGISFFTFTQIAFLVDSYQGKVKEFNFVHYTLFVTYFPHLIAGPVLHHKEMMPQFAKPSTYRFSYDNMMVGLVIFFIGLAKKVMFADTIAVYVHPVFSATTSLTMLDAWGGALCYSLQLYFDFSGYSDMAIGLSRLFGVSLPLNFHSPYKAVNIIEFWRRWHITLSRFLRDYLYIPLGGNRYGRFRRYANLLLTMLLGGLWHGAGWTFVLWGALHGVYLIINHAWHGICQRFAQHQHGALTKFWQVLATLLTFSAVVIAWVLFRADSVTNALAIIKAMLGGNGLTLPANWLNKWGGVGQFLADHQIIAFTADKRLIDGKAMLYIAIGLWMVWFTPNTQQLMAKFKPALSVPEQDVAERWLWQPSWTWLVISVLVAVFSILSISKLSEFIYFQF